MSALTAALNWSAAIKAPEVLREQCGLFCALRYYPDGPQSVLVEHNEAHAVFDATHDGLNAALAWLKALHYMNDTFGVGHRVPWNLFTTYNFADDSMYYDFMYDNTARSVRPPDLYKFRGTIELLEVTEAQLSALRTNWGRRQQYEVTGPEGQVIAKALMVDEKFTAHPYKPNVMLATLTFEGTGNPD